MQSPNQFFVLRNFAPQQVFSVGFQTSGERQAAHHLASGLKRDTYSHKSTDVLAIFRSAFAARLLLSSAWNEGDS
jgi:hypothetical protein